MSTVKIVLFYVYGEEWMCTSEILMGAIKLRGGMVCGSSKFDLSVCSSKSIVLVVYGISQFIDYYNSMMQYLLKWPSDTENGVIRLPTLCFM